MKKIIFKQIQFLLIAILLNTFVGRCFAQSEKSPHDFSLMVDFAYHPKADKIASTKDHFSPCTAFYEGVEARVTGLYSYTIPTPFGENPLVNGNSLVFGAEFELSPVSVVPKATISFTPIAFLNFTLGARVGTGWNILGINGMSEYDDTPAEYKALKPFQNFFCEFNFQSLFMFDVAALVPGDWNHIVLLASYDLRYTMITGVENKSPWAWQGVSELANGLNYYANIIIGYQMPLVLNTVGVQTELWGIFDNKNFQDKYSDFKGNFMNVSINPMAILKFSEKDSLTIGLCFTTRRGFDSEPKKINDRKQSDLNLNYACNEWYFRRIMFRYTRKF